MTNADFKTAHMLMLSELFISKKNALFSDFKLVIITMTHEIKIKASNF